MAMGKLVCEVTIGGQQVPKALTTAAGVVGQFVKTTPGIGEPFYYWDSITVPPGKSLTQIVVDFSQAPLATSDTAANNAAAAACNANIAPSDVITFL